MEHESSRSKDNSIITNLELEKALNKLYTTQDNARLLGFDIDSIGISGSYFRSEDEVGLKEINTLNEKAFALKALVSAKYKEIIVKKPFINYKKEDKKTGVAIQIHIPKDDSSDSVTRLGAHIKILYRDIEKRKFELVWQDPNSSPSLTIIFPDQSDYQGLTYSYTGIKYSLNSDEYKIADYITSKAFYFLIP